jgi:hypothetical protein
MITREHIETLSLETSSKQGYEMFDTHRIPERLSVVSLGGGLTLPRWLRRVGEVTMGWCGTYSPGARSSVKGKVRGVQSASPHKSGRDHGHRKTRASGVGRTPRNPCPPAARAPGHSGLVFHSGRHYRVTADGHTRTASAVTLPREIGVR